MKIDIWRKSKNREEQLHFLSPVWRKSIRFTLQTIGFIFSILLHPNLYEKAINNILLSVEASEREIDLILTLICVGGLYLLFRK